MTRDEMAQKLMAVGIPCVTRLRAAEVKALYEKHLPVIQEAAERIASFPASATLAEHMAGAPQPGPTENPGRLVWVVPKTFNAQRKRKLRKRGVQCVRVAPGRFMRAADACNLQ